MDLVTITDHDSIDGCLELLDRNPDARRLLSRRKCRAGCRSGDVEVHLGVYGMTERCTASCSRSARNVFEVTARLREAGVFFALNHLLHFYRGQLPLDAVSAAARRGAGARGPQRHDAAGAQRAASSELAATRGTAAPALAGIGGSDAHTLRRVGRTWTEAPGSDARRSFSQSLRSRPGTAGRRARRTCARSPATPTASSRRYLREPARLRPARSCTRWRRAACLGVRRRLAAGAVPAARDRRARQAPRSARGRPGRRELAGFDRRRPRWPDRTLRAQLETQA